MHNELHYTEDLDLPIYLLVIGSSPNIPWDDVVPNSIDDLNTSVDGLERIILLKESAYSRYPEAMTGNQMAQYKSDNIDNWTEPLPQV